MESTRINYKNKIDEEDEGKEEEEEESKANIRMQSEMLNMTLENKVNLIRRLRLEMLRELLLPAAGTLSDKVDVRDIESNHKLEKPQELEKSRPRIPEVADNNEDGAEEKYEKVTPESKQVTIKIERNTPESITPTITPRTSSISPPPPPSFKKIKKMTKGQLRRKKQRDAAALAAANKKTLPLINKKKMLNNKKGIKQKQFVSPPIESSKRDLFPRRRTASLKNETRVLPNVLRDVKTAGHISGIRMDNIGEIQLLATLTGVERVGLGEWRSANISKISEKNVTILSSIKSSTKRPRIKIKKQLDFKLDLVEDLFESLHRPKILEKNEMTNRTENELLVTVVDEDHILPSRLKKPFDMSSLIRESPEKQKRMHSASIVYTESISPTKKNKKVGGNKASFLPQIYSKAWEYSIENKKKKELEKLNKSKEFHQKDATNRKKIKRRRKKQQQQRKDRRQEELNQKNDSFQMLLKFEKWLHRSFLKVKDACNSMNKEFTFNELTNLFLHIGIKMDREKILVVLHMIDVDGGDNNNQEDVKRLTLHKIETGIRRSKKNRRY